MKHVVFCLFSLKNCDDPSIFLALVQQNLHLYNMYRFNLTRHVYADQEPSTRVVILSIRLIFGCKLIQSGAFTISDGIVGCSLSQNHTFLLLLTKQIFITLLLKESNVLCKISVCRQINKKRQNFEKTQLI